MGVELRCCGRVRIYIREKPAEGRIRLEGLEVAIIAGGKPARLAFLQMLDGLKANTEGYDSAAKAALVGMMKSTPRGIDLTGLDWAEDEGPEIGQPRVAGALHEQVVSDLKLLAQKGWEVG